VVASSSISKMRMARKNGGLQCSFQYACEE
jgi:hypothetical protein